MPKIVAAERLCDRYDLLMSIASARTCRVDLRISSGESR